MPLDNGGGVRITISRWFTPDHHSVAPDGVQPDIVVNVPDGTPPDQDLFLERAVRVPRPIAPWAEDGTRSPRRLSPPPSPAGMVPATSPVSYDPSGQAVAACLTARHCTASQRAGRIWATKGGGVQ